MIFTDAVKSHDPLISRTQYFAINRVFGSLRKFKLYKLQQVALSRNSYSTEDHYVLNKKDKKLVIYPTAQIDNKFPKDHKFWPREAQVSRSRVLQSAVKVLCSLISVWGDGASWDRGHTQTIAVKVKLQIIFPRAVNSSLSAIGCRTMIRRLLLGARNDKRPMRKATSLKSIVRFADLVDQPERPDILPGVSRPRPCRGQQPANHRALPRRISLHRICRVFAEKASGTFLWGH